MKKRNQEYECLQSPGQTQYKYILVDGGRTKNVKKPEFEYDGHYKRKYKKRNLVG